MRKVEVDLDELATKLSQAVISAVASMATLEKPSEQKTTKKIVNKKVVEVSIPKKRGLPKKEKEEEPTECVEEILKYESPPVDSKSNYIAAAKRIGVDSPIKSLTKAQDIRDPNRKIKFIDYSDVKDFDVKGNPMTPDKYPPRSDRRPAAQMGKFRCDVCKREFEGSYAEFPQALVKFKDPSVGQFTEDRALLKCDDCVARPVIGAI